jgi:hypothetical protein
MGNVHIPSLERVFFSFFNNVSNLAKVREGRNQACGFANSANFVAA